MFYASIVSNNRLIEITNTKWEPHRVEAAVIAVMLKPGNVILIVMNIMYVVKRIDSRHRLKNHYFTLFFFQIKEEKIESSIITERMRERCLIVFDAIMNYCVRSLEIESDASMRCTDGLNEEDFYCTVLYNDETHTFEQVNNRIFKWIH